MEKDSFPNWYGLCGRCKNGNDCNFVMTKDIEKSFFEELSVFYVAVTRAKSKFLRQVINNSQIGAFLKKIIVVYEIARY